MSTDIYLFVSYNLISYNVSDLLLIAVLWLSGYHWDTGNNGTVRINLIFLSIFYFPYWSASVTDQ